MSTTNDKEYESGNVLRFPSPSATPEAPSRALEDVVFETWVSELRSSKTREGLLNATSVDHDTIETLLRQPHIRTRLKQCMQSYLTEQIPRALKLFGDALTGGQSWAFKILLGAIDFSQIASEILPEDTEEEDVLISHAFERELTQNIRDIFLGQDENNQNDKIEPAREED